MTPSGQRLSFEKRLKIGQEYERLVVRHLRGYGVEIDVRSDYQDQLAHGDTTRGLEIKQDDKFHETGRLYIETEARRTSSDVMRPKGIFMPDSSIWYGIGDERVFWIFRRDDLVAYSRTWYGILSKRAEQHFGTSKGFVVWESQADDRLAWCRYNWGEPGWGDYVQDWPGSVPCGQFWGMSIGGTGMHNLNEERRRDRDIRRAQSGLAAGEAGQRAGQSSGPLREDPRGGPPEGFRWA